MATAGTDDTLTTALKPILPHLGQYWLDSGTLLGVVRDGGFISWDSDIDLAIWETEVPRLLAGFPQLRAMGMDVSTRSYRGRLYGVTISDRRAGTPPIHVHVYFRAGPVAWSPQTVAYAEVNRTGPTASFPGSAATRRVLWPIKREALAFRRGTLFQRTYRTVLCVPIWGAVAVVRDRLDRQSWSAIWPLSSLYATYTWKVPAHFFDTLTIVQHGSLALPVPTDANGYLAARYGNWREPDPNWIYWLDDGCLFPAPPEAALEGRT